MLLYTSKYQGFGKQKPEQWGNVSDVRSAVFRNAERMGIDPASLVGYWPIWETAGSPRDIMMSAPPAIPYGNPAYDTDGLCHDGNDHTTLGDNAKWCGDALSIFFTARLDALTASGGLFSKYDLSTGGRSWAVRQHGNNTFQFVGSEGGSSGAVYAESASDIFTVGAKSSFVTVFSGGNFVRFYKDGGLHSEETSGILNSLYCNTGIVAQLNRYANYFSSCAYENCLLVNAVVGPNQIAQIHETPYALLAPNPSPLIFDLAAGGGYTLTAEGGSTTLTGQAAALLKDSIIAAGSGSVVLSGQDVSLLRDALLSAEAGSYTLTGQDAPLLLNRLLSADAGSVELTGYDVTLTYSPLGGYTLSAESGSFTLTGQAASLLKDSKLSAGSGSITLDGQTADLLFNRLLSSDAGTFTITGADAEFLRDYKLAAGAGNITLSGQAVTLDYSGVILPDGKVSITFTVSAPSSAFSVKGPSTTYTVH
jgi:hypothetical protein